MGKPQSQSSSALPYYHHIIPFNSLPHPLSTSTSTPMPTKLKISAEAYNGKVTEWSKKLYNVVTTANEGKYRDFHDSLFKEYKTLRNEAQSLDTTTTTVTAIDHVAPVYDHIASQGYITHIHYSPLVQAVINFCEEKPVAAWKGPPELSRSSSPHPANLSTTKTRAAITEELIPSDQDDSEKEGGESVKTRKATNAAKSHNAEDDPSTEGMERCPTKCTKCASRKHGCHVNPKATKSGAACFECNHWRLKCSHAATRAVTAKRVDEEEEGASKDPGAPPKRRNKKTNLVPAGQTGQSTSKPLSPFF